MSNEILLSPSSSGSTLKATVSPPAFGTARYTLP